MNYAKSIIILIAAMLLLSACSKQAPESDLSTPTGQSDSLSLTSKAQPGNPPPVTEAPDATHEYIPSVRVSAALEEGYTIIAALDNDWIDNPVYVYLYANQLVNDVLISGLYESSDNKLIEREGILYVPELLPRQVVKLLDPYPNLSDTDKYYTQIAYVNSNGDYEAVLLHGDKEKENPSLLSAEPGISEAIYDEDYLGNEQFIISDFFSAKFREKTLAGEFDSYVPKGLRIAGGTIGDVNGDGIKDALMYLITDGHRSGSYVGVMPLFILTGGSDGKYLVEKKVADALFTPYRTSSYAIAGDGYIDIVHDYVGGAGCHHTQVCRFQYFPGEKDWILKEISYQPTYALNYSEILAPEFVRPLLPMVDLSLEKLSGSEYYNCFPDWTYFDEVCELTSPDNVIYTLGVRLNNAEGYYEGYIYKYYESIQKGGFIQTIRGVYNSDVKPEIYEDSENYAFIINQDVWKMDEHDSDSFHLVR